MELCELDFSNKQQVFDFVLNKVVEQGEKSSTDGYFSSCCYRLNKNGKQLKCGIGHLISDQEYNSGFEGKGVIGLVTEYNFSKFYPAVFYDDLQLAHDRAVEGVNFVCDFKENMKDLAIMYEFIYNEPQAQGV